MKICDAHKFQLRLELTLKGLGYLVANSGEEIQKRGAANPCPLNTALGNLLASVVVGNPSFALVAHDRCPFCTGADESWIKLAADDMANGPFKDKVRVGQA